MRDVKQRILGRGKKGREVGKREIKFRVYGTNLAILIKTQTNKNSQEKQKPKIKNEKQN